MIRRRPCSPHSADLTTHQQKSPANRQTRSGPTSRHVPPHHTGRKRHRAEPGNTRGWERCPRPHSVRLPTTSLLPAGAVRGNHRSTNGRSAEHGRSGRRVAARTSERRCASSSYAPFSVTYSALVSRETEPRERGRVRSVANPGTGRGQNLHQDGPLADWASRNRPDRKANPVTITWTALAPADRRAQFTSNHTGGHQRIATRTPTTRRLRPCGRVGQAAQGTPAAASAGLPKHERGTRVLNTAPPDRTPWGAGTPFHVQRLRALGQTRSPPRTACPWPQRVQRRKWRLRRRDTTSKARGALRPIADLGTSSVQVYPPRVVEEAGESHRFARVALNLRRGTPQSVVIAQHNPYTTWSTERCDCGTALFVICKLAT